MAGVGLVAVVTPQKVTQQIEEAGKPITQERVIDSLASHLKTMWEDARNHKVSSGLTERLLECDRQRRGEYSPAKLQEIRKTGGSEIYMMLTDIKCRAALSWIKDVMQLRRRDVDAGADCGTGHRAGSARRHHPGRG
jgi:hypothetical protein